MHGLTQKQLHYVEARLQGLAPTAAARAAGLSDGDSGQYERAPRVREAMRWAVQQGMKQAEDIDKNDVISGMMDAVTAAGTAAELVMAWREIGKLIGAYQPEKKVLEIHTYNEKDIKSLPSDELMRLAGKELQDVIEGEFAEVNSGAVDGAREAAERREELDTLREGRAWQSEGPPVEDS